MLKILKCIFWYCIYSGEASTTTCIPTRRHTLSPHTSPVALGFSVKDIVSLPLLPTERVADGLTTTGVRIEGPFSLNNLAENVRVCWVGWLNTLTCTDRITCHYTYYINISFFMCSFNQNEPYMWKFLLDKNFAKPSYMYLCFFRTLISVEYLIIIMVKVTISSAEISMYTVGYRIALAMPCIHIFLNVLDGLHRR